MWAELSIIFVPSVPIQRVVLRIGHLGIKYFFILSFWVLSESQQHAGFIYIIFIWRQLK
jgi:hypothetical protein